MTISPSAVPDALVPTFAQFRNRRVYIPIRCEVPHCPHQVPRVITWGYLLQAVKIPEERSCRLHPSHSRLPPPVASRKPFVHAVKRRPIVHELGFSSRKFGARSPRCTRGCLCQAVQRNFYDRC